MKPCTVLFLAAMLAASGAVVRGASIAVAAARSECDPWALRPCAPVILWSAPPSSACCAKLREQRRCLCRYARDPDLGRYINSQTSKEVAAACRVRVPMC